MIQCLKSKNGSGVIVLIGLNEENYQLNISSSDWKLEDKIREHGIGAQIIRDLGVKEMILLRNLSVKFRIRRIWH